MGRVCLRVRAVWFFCDDLHDLREIEGRSLEEGCVFGVNFNTNAKPQFEMIFIFIVGLIALLCLVAWMLVW